MLSYNSKVTTHALGVLSSYPLLLLANIIQENFREKTHSIETERGTKM